MLRLVRFSLVGSFVASLFGVSLVACTSEVSSFGLATSFVEPDGTKGASCVLAGNAQGGEAVRLDHKANEAKNAFPHLWYETHQDGGNTPYRLEVYTVSAYVEGTLVPAQKTVLKSASYDEAFGASSATDTLSVEFEGETYTIRVFGIPSNATTCPPLESLVADGATPDAKGAETSTGSAERFVCDARTSHASCSGVTSAPCDEPARCRARLMVPGAPEVFSSCFVSPACGNVATCIAKAGEVVADKAATDYVSACLAKANVCGEDFPKVDDDCTTAVYAFAGVGPAAAACLQKSCGELKACFSKAFAPLAACK
jgi:hypothetical protein